MKFRKDINGLRAIAVIAVVLFHFNREWMPGGFAGVDVFFVISGFLMTGIIFRGIEKDDFSVLKFYVARANRIIPALAILCCALLVFGWFYIPPLGYEGLGKHIASSMAFASNIIYWREAGYFDTASHGKWLLHTWSLSVEWQFYIIYPLVLVAMRKIMPIRAMKVAVLLGTILGFIFGVIATYKWPSASYFLLPTRAWEMTIGGVAYLYPINLGEKKKRALELLGMALVLSSYILISENNPWPGYLALFPVVGTFLIIQAQRNDSLFTGNVIFQNLGRWSYSIYLWHWPLVVAIYHYSLSTVWIYVGLVLSMVFGFLSSKYIESITFEFRGHMRTPLEYVKCKPIYIALITGITGAVVFLEDGLVKHAPIQYQNLIREAAPSPYRERCHTGVYREPSLSCEYFSDKVEWAVFGDSHSTEIAYALAERLRPSGVGVKQFSFSNCKPSYLEDEGFSKCAKWYNESIAYIEGDPGIKNVVINHRYTYYLMDGDAADFSKTNEQIETAEIKRLVRNLDALIFRLSAVKDNVYVFYPIPELQKNVIQLIGVDMVEGRNLEDISGTSSKWYNDRNKLIIEHFNNASYPSNVHLVNVRDVFCDEYTCFAVRGAEALYFDDNHPSVLGARRLVDSMEMNMK